MYTLPDIVSNIRSLTNIQIGVVILAPNEPIPVGHDHTDPPITFKCKLQAKETSEKFLGPPDLRREFPRPG